MTANDIQVGDKVSFRLCDSEFHATGTVEEVTDNRNEYLESMRVEYSRYLYTIRDDRNGWVHRMGTTRAAGSVRKITPSPPKVNDEPWDGKF